MHIMNLFKCASTEIESSSSWTFRHLSGDAANLNEIVSLLLRHSSKQEKDTQLCAYTFCRSCFLPRALKAEKNLTKKYVCFSVLRDGAAAASKDRRQSMKYSGSCKWLPSVILSRWATSHCRFLEKPEPKMDGSCYVRRVRAVEWF